MDIMKIIQDSEILQNHFYAVFFEVVMEGDVLSLRIGKIVLLLSYLAILNI